MRYDRFAEPHRHWIATHEAGHAALAASLGLLIDWVSIEEDGGYTLAWTRPSWPTLSVALAGAAASLAAGLPGDFSASDLAAAVPSWRAACCHSPLGRITEALADVFSNDEVLTAGVNAVRDALLAEGIVNGGEVADLVRQAVPWRRTFDDHQANVRAACRRAAFIYS